MRMQVGLTLLVVSMIAADKPNENSKKELKKFDGVWRIEKIENDGTKTPEEECKRMKLTIENGKYKLTQDDATISSGTIKVDASKKPMAIDISASEGEGSNQEMLGIFELDGDKMKVCYGRPGESRPTKLSADSGSSAILVVAVKQKKEKKDT